MTLSKTIVQERLVVPTREMKPFPVWSASGDSTVGHVEIASIGIPSTFRVTILNKTLRKPLIVQAWEMDHDWLAAPRIAVKWLNVGSRWRERDAFNSQSTIKSQVKRPDWVVTNAPSSSGVVILESLTDRHSSPQRKGITCFELMNKYVRLWGHNEHFPEEPVPYQKRVRKAVKRVVRKTRLDLLLERDILED